jgi:TIR domain
MAISIDPPSREPRVLLVVTPENRTFGKQVQAELTTSLQAELTTQSQTNLVELFCGDVENAATAIDSADIILLITQTGDTSEALKLKTIGRVAVQVVDKVVWFFLDTNEQKELFKDYDYVLVTVKSSNLGLGSWIHLRLIRSEVWYAPPRMRALAAAAKRWDHSGRSRELLIDEYSIPIPARYHRGIILEFLQMSRWIASYNHIAKCYEAWRADPAVYNLIRNLPFGYLAEWLQFRPSGAPEIDPELRKYIDISIAEMRRPPAPPEPTAPQSASPPLRTDPAATRRTPALGVTRMENMRQELHRPTDPAPASADPVDFSIFAPSSVLTGSEFFVQVMLHLAGELATARERATEIDDTAVLRGTSTLQAPIPTGSHVTVTLEADKAALEIWQPIQSITWSGSLVALNFVVRSLGLSKIIFPVVRVACDGAIIGEMRFKVSIVAPDHSASLESSLQEAECKRYRRVFFSYSSLDRARVLEIAQSYRILGVSFFQDILSLGPGQRWERGLYKEIDACDLFLLFWSYVSCRSEWVAKEAQYALERQRQTIDHKPDIVPFILDGPPPPEVPAFLSHLHFDDWMRYAIMASASKVATTAIPREAPNILRGAVQWLTVLGTALAGLLHKRRR